MIEATENIDNLKNLFDSLNGQFQGIRERWWYKLEQKGWPTRRDEEYKFTPLEPIINRNIDFANCGFGHSLDIEYVQSKFYDVEGHHLVFINGQYNSDWSKRGTDVINISSFNELNEDKVQGLIDQFGDDRTSVSINFAFLSNGISVNLNKSESASPIFIYHFRDASSTPSLSFPFVHIHASENSELQVFEKSFSNGAHSHLASHFTAIEVEKNARVHFTKIQDFEKLDFTLDNLFVQQHGSSHFFANTFSLSGGLIRNNLEITLNGEHSEANMYGLYFLDGKSHVDNHTVVDHRHPNCDSNELYKGIVDEQATAVFNGKIFVRQPAQKTNAFQSNNNVSLSDTATIHTKPQLEIWADDVKCSHGCTIGQLDQEALFYLMSRGIEPHLAKAMLLGAFAEEALDHVSVEIIKEEISNHIHNRLGA